MRYVEARFNQYRREETYRIFVTDALYASQRGLSVTARYADLAHPKPEKPADNRTQDEIVAQVWGAIRGKKAVSK